MSRPTSALHASVTAQLPESALPRHNGARPASARPWTFGQQQSALPRAKLQRPISAMGRPISADLQAGPAHRPPQRDIVRPASALGLNKHGLPDFRAPPTKCPASFDRSGYAAWESGAKGNQKKDIVEVIDVLAKAPLQERKRPGLMERHVGALKPRFDEIEEILSVLPETDTTRAQIQEDRKKFLHALEECIPLALIPPPDYEEEKQKKLAEWEDSLDMTKNKPEDNKKKAYSVNEGGFVDPNTGSLDRAILMQFKEAQALVHQVSSRKLSAPLLTTVNIILCGKTLFS